MVGGDRLRCRELERDKKGNADKWSSGVAYCWESLADTYTNAVIGKSKRVPVKNEYRPYEWNALELLREDITHWFEKYTGERRVMKAKLLFQVE